MTKAYRTPVPRPDKEVEAKSQGSGPVTTYKMSPEELEDYRARTAFKQKNKVPAALVQKHPSIVEPKAEEGKDMAHKPKEIDKNEVIKLIASGLSYHKIEEKLGIPKSTLRYRLKKMDLLGLDQVKAKQLLNGETVSDRQELLRESDVVKKAPYDAEFNFLKDRCIQLERTISEMEQVDNKANEMLLEVMADRDHHKKVAEFYKLEASNMKANFERNYAEFRETLEELTTDRNEWRDAAERYKAKLETPCTNVIAAGTTADMVNHPEHYKIGGIETIDFIKAKLTPAEFEGYCKGNVLKYVARASYKGGIEDLRKAGKYIEFAVVGRGES